MPEIEYAFLADAAQVQPGSKFHVLGGGISRLTGPTFPFVHPHLSLVVGLRVAVPERNREYELGFIVASPDGASITTANGRVVARGNGDAGDLVLTIAIDLWNLNFTMSGEHAVRILIDGAEKKRLGLTVAQVRETMPEQRYLA
jgi:hypothetical protein